ncbi:MAG: RdgB/HAM1 family non-canonical purine NTP pyrophosphatase [Nitrosopumilaceae archaeon]|nr:RdgB/HAM1 family non-canonical purine NTP pyrophosphatase [Nitrosopumilaceae archaeon]
MQQSSELFFVSSNKHKYQEAKQILKDYGIHLKLSKQNLQEIQSDSIKKISQHKAKQAFEKLKKPVIVEDDSLEIDSLNGFPGPYSSYVFKTIGNNGILQLIKENRNAKFHSTITFCDKNNLISFSGVIAGTISKKPKGTQWGYDPIFIPKNNSKTFAQIEIKNKLSHRFSALKKFSNWYMQESICR